MNFVLNHLESAKTPVAQKSGVKIVKLETKLKERASSKAHVTNINTNHNLKIFGPAGTPNMIPLDMDVNGKYINRIPFQY
jgi:hypothetical protein